MTQSKSIGLFVAALALLPIQGWAVPGEKPMVPQDTRVLILPVLEKSGRTGEEKEVFIQSGLAALQEEFRKAGFVMIEHPDLPAAARELNIALDEEAQRSRENLGRLAEHEGARLVVSTVIRSVESNWRRNLFSDRKQGTAIIEMTVFDSEIGDFVTQGTYRATKKGGVWAPTFERFGKKRTGAIVAAIQKGVKAFLSQSQRQPASAVGQ